MTRTELEEKLAKAVIKRDFICDRLEGMKL